MTASPVIGVASVYLLSASGGVVTDITDSIGTITITGMQERQPRGVINTHVFDAGRSLALRLIILSLASSVTRRWVVGTT